MSKCYIITINTAVADYTAPNNIMQCTIVIIINTAVDDYTICTYNLE